ncbi:hypothetical protein Tco_0746962 [Tanacetum coccineum]
MLYLCLHLPKITKETRSNMPYPEEGNTKWATPILPWSNMFNLKLRELLETEFPAIFYNDALASKSDFSSKPTVCIFYNDALASIFYNDAYAVYPILPVIPNQSRIIWECGDQLVPTPGGILRRLEAFVASLIGSGGSDIKIA